MNRNVRQLLWLVLCFPVGLTMMWKNSCRWKLSVKYAVSSLVLVALIAVLVIPSPNRKLTGAVELVGSDKAVEVYGPELPENAVAGYVAAASGNTLADASSTATDITYVYAAKGARCYHLEDCKFAFASAQKLTVYEAYFLGYEPCGRCNPPAYSGNGAWQPDTAATDTAATDTEDGTATADTAAAADGAVVTDGAAVQ